MKGFVVVLAVVSSHHVFGADDCPTLWTASGLSNAQMSEGINQCTIDCNGQALGTYSIPPELGSLTNLNQNCTTIYVDLTGTSQKVTGTIPSELENFPARAAFDFSDQSLEGSIPQAVRQNLVVQSLNLENNALSGTLGDFLGWQTEELTYLKLSGNTITGSYGDSDLSNLLKNAPKLLGFSLQLSGTIEGCLDIGDITAHREQRNYADLFIEIPEEAKCKATPQPTITQTMLPTSPPTPKPPTQIPTRGPTSPIAPTSNSPTRAPISVPSNAPTQGPTRHPTRGARTLSPNTASSPQFSFAAVGVSFVVGVLALI